MPVPTIQNGRTQFFPILYEGNGTGQRVGQFVPFTDDGTIANSCVFDDGSPYEYLSRTPGSASNRRTFTFSCWIKLGAGTINSGAEKAIFSARDGSSNNYSILSINGDQSGANQLEFVNRTASGYAGYAYTTRTLKDSTKWYHVMVAVDTTDNEPNDRIKLYIDGDRATVTYSDPGEDTDMAVNNNVAHAIGARPTNNFHWDGYIAEANFVDGSALTPDTFGVTDTSTGRWVPKELSGITYGTNGFRLAFGTGSAMGDDTANSNDFALTNIDAANQTTDSPTQNHMTFGGRTGSSITLSQGNLKVSVGPADTKCLTGMGIPTSGKYYWEVTLTTLSTYGRIGVAPADANLGFSPTTDGIAYDRPETAGGMKVLGTDIGSGWDGAFTQGNIMNFALDADNKFLYIGENNVWRNSGDPTSGATGTGGVPYGGTSLQDKILYPSVGSGNAGGTKVYDFNFGQKTLSYSPPTGYVTLQQDNLPEASEGLSGLVWTKNRDASDDHQLYDSLRGKHLRVTTDSTAVEATVVGGVQKFLAGGQSIGSDDAINTSGETFITWNWTGNGGTSVTNDASATGVGDIDSVYQANTTGGFSIVTYTGTGSAGTIAHGLGSKPHWVMSKPRDNSSDGFSVLHNSLGTDFLDLETNALPNTNTVVWDAVPTPTVFSVGSATGTNSTGVKYIAYCWSPIEGFSKFGSYTGNATSTGDGTFVYTGFKPAWLMVKRTSGTTGNWVIMDSTRSPINPVATFFNADGKSEVTTAARQTDFLSNGFKFRGNNPATNASASYVYFAFAEHPFIGSQTLKGFSPVTAR